MYVVKIIHIRMRNTDNVFNSLPFIDFLITRNLRADVFCFKTIIENDFDVVNWLKAFYIQYDSNPSKRHFRLGWNYSFQFATSLSMNFPTLVLDEAVGAFLEYFWKINTCLNYDDKLWQLIDDTKVFDIKITRLKFSA